MKLSKWIDGSKFVPAHVGIYEIKSYSEFYECFSSRYWDGEKWSMGWFHECSMEYQKLGTSSNQSIKWRGLANNPSKQSKKFKSVGKLIAELEK